MRIALLGAECTGKTQLTRALVKALNDPAGTAVGVAEVLRTWCNTNTRAPQQHEQWAIAQQQALHCAQAPDRGYVIADTTPLVTAIYSDLLFQDRSLYPFALQHQSQYDLTLVMGLDLPWVADGIQRDGPAMRSRFDARLREVLAEQPLAYGLVYGSDTTRTTSALQAIAHHCGIASCSAPLRASTWQWRCEKCSDARCEHQLFSTLVQLDSVRDRATG